MERDQDYLQQAICELAEEHSLIVAPWRDDFHCDHLACSRAAIAAATVTKTCLAEAFFWTWHYTTAARLAGRPLVHFALSEEQKSRRTEAIAVHESQTGAIFEDTILFDDDLEPMRWPKEFFHLDPNLTPALAV